MSFDLPPHLRERIEALAAVQGKSGLRARSDELSSIYGEGRSSSQVDVAAYLTARMPATYAAVSAVFHEVAKLMPDFSPQSLLDIGAGPGTASLSAQHAWPSVQSFELVERDARFAAVATELVRGAKLSQKPLQQVSGKADLVVAAYVLAELPEEEAASAAARLWASADNVFIVIEPGTPSGFARVRQVREVLVKAGAQMVGPCTHVNPCPMQSSDWCHFKVRLARARSHMHAKGATVPFEDESFSWVAFARQPVAKPRARIIAPPAGTKFAISLPLCSAVGLTTETFASRDKATYKQARKLNWGDSLTA